MKSVAQSVIKPLEIVINKCLTEGTFPDELKTAKIIPIYKKGDTSIAENYRPIAILPAMSKILEYVIAHRLMVFLEKNDYISSAQHGYRKRMSTITNIEELMKMILEGIDNRECVQLMCCDLSKAFDTVDHTILLEKLYYYGIRGKAHDMLSSYLSGRTQYVDIGESRSVWVQIKQGVPQGSVLGPLLFIIYVNDLQVNLSAAKVCLYADDTSILIKEKSKVDALEIQKVVMEEAMEWFTANKLMLNNEKTQCMQFTTGRGEEDSHVKVLGIHIDNKLQWSEHINKLSRRLSVAVYTIRRIRQVSTYEAARLTYYANFHSVAKYGIQFWGAAVDANRVFLLQKRAIRALYQLQQIDSCREWFISGGILTLPSEYILTVTSVIHENVSKYDKNCETHSYNTRHKEDLKTPYHRLQLTQRTTDFWGTKIYNRLPKNFKDLPVKIFKQKLKNMLLESAFYSIDEFFNHTFI